MNIFKICSIRSLLISPQKLHLCAYSLDVNVAKTNNEGEKYKPVLSGICTPKLTEKEIKSINSILSIHTGLTHIGWARIESHENTLTHLNHVILPPNFSKMQLCEMYSLITKLVKSMPDADVYVMENLPKRLKAKGITQMSYEIASINMNTIILTHLNDCKPNVTNSHSVVSLNPLLPGKLFDLLVGSEIVSSLKTVNDLLTNKKNSISCITTSEEIRTSYNKLQNVEKEILGRSILLGLSFLDILVNQNEQSLKILTKMRTYNGISRY